MATLAQKLRDRNHGWFVGRSREIAFLREIFSSADPPKNVVYFHGPSGIGKTSVLQEAVFLAGSMGYNTCFVTLGGQTPESLMQAIGVAVPRADNNGSPAIPNFMNHFRADPWGGAADVPIPPRTVLALDGLDNASPEVLKVLSEKILGELDASCFALLASNRPVAVIWKEWQNLMQVCPLSSWTFHDVEEYTHLRGLNYSAEELYRITGGHPAAVAAVCDTFWEGGTGIPSNRPFQLLNGIVERIVLENPHLASLIRMTSVPRYFTVDLLEQLLGQPVSTDDVEALSRLSFMIPGERGLHVLESVRRSVYRDFALKEPTTVARLHGICRNYFQPIDIVEYLYHSAILEDDKGVLGAMYDPFEEDSDAYEVRTGTVADSPEMLLLDQGVYSEGWQVDLDYCRAILAANPDVYRVLRVGGRLKGYYSAVPLNEEGFNQLFSGELAEADLPAYIVPYAAGQAVHIYFTSIVVDKTDGSHRHYAARLLQDWLEMLGRIAREQVEIRRIGAFAVTEDGTRLATKLGLQLVGQVDLGHGRTPAGIYQTNLRDMKSTGLIGRALASVAVKE